MSKTIDSIFKDYIPSLTTDRFNEPIKIIRNKAGLVVTTISANKLNAHIAAFIENAAEPVSEQRTIKTYPLGDEANNIVFNIYATTNLEGFISEIDRMLKDTDTTVRDKDGFMLLRCKNNNGYYTNTRNNRTVLNFKKRIKAKKYYYDKRRASHHYYDYIAIYSDVNDTEEDDDLLEAVSLYIVGELSVTKTYLSRNNTTFLSRVMSYNLDMLEPITELFSDIVNTKWGKEHNLSELITKDVLMDTFSIIKRYLYNIKGSTTEPTMY